MPCPVICQGSTYLCQGALIAPTVHQHSSVHHSWFAPDSSFNFTQSHHSRSSEIRSRWMIVQWPYCIGRWRLTTGGRGAVWLSCLCQGWHKLHSWRSLLFRWLPRLPQNWASPVETWLYNETLFPIHIIFLIELFKELRIQHQLLIWI